LAPGHAVNPGDTMALSTITTLYNLILPDSKMQTPAMGFVDVRDVAAALVAGIKTPGQNRVLLTGEWFEVKDAVDYIGVVRPELKSRLPKLLPTGQTRAVIDNTRALEVLGVRVTPWKDMVIDATDFMLKLEVQWQNAGVEVEATLQKSIWRA